VKPTVIHKPADLRAWLICELSGLVRNDEIVTIAELLYRLGLRCGLQAGSDWSKWLERFNVPDELKCLMSPTKELSPEDLELQIPDEDL
jgi:hypothetical protein